jgi:hypothetical protein
MTFLRIRSSQGFALNSRPVRACVYAHLSRQHQLLTTTSTLFPTIIDKSALLQSIITI